MTTTEILEALPFRAPKIKEINQALEALNESHEYLDLFLENNPAIASNVKTHVLVDYLLQITTNLIKKKTPMSVTKNVYDEFAIIFAILSLNEPKSKINKFGNMLIATVQNSSKFDLYSKKRINMMRLSSDNDIFETFWLIPLFVNSSVLLATDVTSFIRENKEIARNVEGYVEGYSDFVYNSDILNIDKQNFKLYLVEGIKANQAKK